MKNWIYEAQCYRCHAKFEGSQSECQQWVLQNCESNIENDQVAIPHAGVIDAAFLPGEYKCTSCKRIFVRVKGGEATEELCEPCVIQGKQPSRQENGTRINLNCGSTVSFSPKNIYGNLFSHVRKSFLFGGETWACCGRKTTYDTISGESTYACGKKAEFHIKLPNGFSFQNGQSDSECGIVCGKCASQLLKITGSANIGF